MTLVYLAPDGELELWRSSRWPGTWFVEAEVRDILTGFAVMESELYVDSPETIQRVLIGEL
jgi:hypothetical protein